MKKLNKQSGVSLIETLTVVLLLMIMAAGMTAVFGFCTGANKSQGELATRATEVAQDKMEELMSLTFADATTNTTVPPPFPANGNGLGGAMPANTTVGSIAQGGAVAGYVDYLDINGVLLGGPGGAFYTRQWSIATNPTGTVKTITVVSFAANTGGGPGAAASSLLVCLKNSNS